MSEGKIMATAMSFNETRLTSNKKHTAINAAQFLTSVANNLRARLFNSTHDNLLKLLAVLEPNYWPDVDNMEIDYGEK